jgi:hypothetical protein
LFGPQYDQETAVLHSGWVPILSWRQDLKRFGHHSWRKILFSPLATWHDKLRVGQALMLPAKNEPFV